MCAAQRAQKQKGGTAANGRLVTTQKWHAFHHEIRRTVAADTSRYVGVTCAVSIRCLREPCSACCNVSGAYEAQLSQLWPTAAPHYRGARGAVCMKHASANEINQNYSHHTRNWSRYSPKVLIALLIEMRGKGEKLQRASDTYRLDNITCRTSGAGAAPPKRNESWHA